MDKSEFYIHLGLPKTGTTFLQENIFSKFDSNDISFLGKAKCVSIWDLMEMPSNKYLISSEHLLANPFTCPTGKWFEVFKANLKKVHHKFPNAKYILTLRKHESLILSYYKEHISKGNRSIYPSLKKFYDVQNDNGQVSKNDFYFKEMIEEIEKITSQRPFVFFQERLKNNPNLVINDLETFLNIPKQNIDLVQGKKTNQGVKHRQSILLIFFNKINKITRGFGLNLYSPFLVKRGLTPDYLIRSKLSWLSDKPLQFTEEISAFITENYKEDLEWVNNYIKYQNNI